MNNELALRTIGYLIGHYKTHNETIINSQEIEAIEFIIKENQKYKEVIDKAIEWVKDWRHGANDWFEEDSKPSELLDILNEVSVRKER